MRSVKILRLTLENFKCHRLLNISLQGSNATIYGDNAAGKTSIYDGLTWLLFGKDSAGNGEKNIEIKPLDSDGNVADHSAVTSVEAELLVDGESVTLKRTYKEVWATKRGSASETFTGNTSEYYIDGVPHKKNVFDDKVHELVSEDVFRLLTSVNYFAAELSWQKRRGVLFDMAGTLTDREIMAQDQRFAPLLEALGRLELEDYKKKLSAEKRNLTGAKTEIPARISECQKTVEDLQELDFAGAKAELEALNARKEVLSEEILAIENDTALSRKRLELREATLELDALEKENESFRKSQKDGRADPLLMKREVDALRDRLNRKKGMLDVEEQFVALTEEKIEASRREWMSITDERFVGGTCLSCGQTLPADKLQRAMDAFEKGKKDRLRRIEANAAELKNTKAAAEYLSEQPSGRQTVDAFGGYNHNLRIGDGEFYDMENLSGDCYPVMSVRPRRAHMLQEEGVTGIVWVEGGLYFTKGECIHRQGINNPVVANLGLSDSPKKFVQMGAYVLILPDMKYITLPDSGADRGACAVDVTVNSGKVTYELCDGEGKPYSGAIKSETEPENPENGTLWLDTAATPHSLKKYSSASKNWASITSTFVRIKVSELPEGMPFVGLFGQYDGVEISGAAVSSLNGATILYHVGGQYIVVSGLLDETVEQDCAEHPFRIQRKVPEMDYVIEAGNRLWGCHYGKNAQGQMVNEIYCSKLGDFKNWNCFMGLSTDSWVASVGSSGPFTGAVNHGGYPIFFKENMKHKVWISETGGHQITSTPCRGVASGSGDSLAVINGLLYYKSTDGICVDDGGMPTEIGQVFGGRSYSNAVAVGHRSKYYVSMQSNDEWHLFVYDTEKKLWHREDNLHVVSFCSTGGMLFAADADTGEVKELTLGTAIITHNGVELIDGPVKWMAETGPLGLSSPDTKYISRITLRLSMEAGAELTVYAQYDMEPEWVALGSIRGTSLRSFSLPIRPHRCDHMRLRLEGEGDVKLYSITKTVKEGGERP